jgi:hypothetical protein
MSGGMTVQRDRHALVLCFNEDYTKYVDKLMVIYKARFSQVTCIAPDHYGQLERYYRYPGYPSYAVVNGADRTINRCRRVLGRRNLHEAEFPTSIDVWRVQGFKHYFHDFFWQVRKKLVDLRADWYWFVADDLLLHPNLNEENVGSLIHGAQSRSVICKPVFARDDWSAWFHGSVDHVVESLRACETYPLDAKDYDFPDDPIRQGRNSHRIISACADFFGCHREMLLPVLERFHRLAKRKVFVEVAVPNTILCLDPHASYLDSYQWDFAEDRGSERKIAAFVASGGKHLFYHPAKLSTLDEPWLVRTFSSTG